MEDEKVSNALSVLRSQHENTTFSQEHHVPACLRLIIAEVLLCRKPLLFVVEMVWKEIGLGKSDYKWICLVVQTDQTWHQFLLRSVIITSVKMEVMKGCVLSKKKMLLFCANKCMTKHINSERKCLCVCVIFDQSHTSTKLGEWIWVGSAFLILFLSMFPLSFASFFSPGRTSKMVLSPLFSSTHLLIPPFLSLHHSLPSAVVFMARADLCQLELF